MNEGDKIRLRVNRRDIVENVQTEEICHRLIAEGILNEDDDERIRAEKTSRDKAATLLNMLPKKGPNAYKAFYDGLCQDPVYEWIIKKLDETDVSGIEDVAKSKGMTVTDVSSLVGKDCEPMENNKKMLEFLSSPMAPVHIVKDTKPKISPKYIIKMTVVGHTASGKTSLLDYWQNNRFNASQHATIGASFQVKVMSTNIGGAKLEVWDTAGQEAYMKVSQTYLRGSRCVVILIDVTNAKSLESALHWYGLCKEFGRDYCVFMCNKTDLKDRVELDKETVEEAIGDNPCFWVSAKTGENVNNAFSMAALGAVVRASAQTEPVRHINILRFPEGERRWHCILL